MVLFIQDRNARLTTTIRYYFIRNTVTRAFNGVQQVWTKRRITEKKRVLFFAEKYPVHKGVNPPISGVVSA